MSGRKQENTNRMKAKKKTKALLHHANVLGVPKQPSTIRANGKKTAETMLPNIKEALASPKNSPVSSKDKRKQATHPKKCQPVNTAADLNVFISNAKGKYAHNVNNKKATGIKQQANMLVHKRTFGEVPCAINTARATI